ncbi:NVEALA domain-containing protein [Bacteroides sp. 224]|uniref:NVEALA domain-containing protein n=1 Tax=Bacteroides sp. 224 TaxID=2302936 RepID=UPI0013D44064|nr:NVEALA domain-containing protein [Bacteroides sp. 224]NDV66546.1 hypothetical protein [Bacteroides sp. 224]
MKKNILKVAIVAMFALFAGYNVYTSQVKDSLLSDLMLNNIEALADDKEGNAPSGCYATICSSDCVVGNVRYIYESSDDCSCDLCTGANEKH